VCSKCGYALRGLADGQCPECGLAFKRGQLLVQQYVREYGKRFRGKLERLASRGFQVAVTIYVVFFGALYVTLAIARFGTDDVRLQIFETMFQYRALTTVVFYVVGLSSILYFVTLILNVRFSSRFAKRRQRVLDALTKPNPD
jgi:hypothetical protein